MVDKRAEGEAVSPAGREVFYLYSLGIVGENITIIIPQDISNIDKHDMKHDKSLTEHNHKALNSGHQSATVT